MGGSVAPDRVPRRTRSQRIPPNPLMSIASLVRRTKAAEGDGKDGPTIHLRLDRLVSAEPGGFGTPHTFLYLIKLFVHPRPFAASEPPVSNRPLVYLRMDAGGKGREKVRRGGGVNKAPAALDKKRKRVSGHAFAFPTDYLVGGRLERLNDGTDPFSGAMLLRLYD